MQPTGKPFYLKPPQLIPGVDESVKTSTTMAPEPPTKPEHVQHVGPRSARQQAPLVQEPVLAPATEAPDDADADMPYASPGTLRIPSKAEYAASAAKAMVPQAGPGRDSYFSRFMESFATNSDQAVDVKIMEALNDWCARMITTHTTAETVLRDFGAAMTEKGVAIDVDIKALEKFVHQLIWIRNMRHLIESLSLADYSDAIIAREIYTEFGRGAEVEADIAKSKKQAFDLEEFVREHLVSINQSISDLKRGSEPPKPETNSVFRSRVRGTSPVQAQPAPPAKS